LTTESRVLITPDALRAIVARARRDGPNETCGLLVGRGDHILEAVEAENTAADPTRQYEISPVDYFNQIKRCRRISEHSGETFTVIGAYHSHPRSLPEPSPTDLQQAFHEFVYLIVGPVPEGRGLEARAYRLGDGAFEPLQLRIADD
jgi:proteasome lid subunit RPN8/RPN11